MTDTEQARTRWEERYAGDDYLYGVEPNEFLRSAVEDVALGEVLCVADGEGRNGVHLALIGHRVTSLDLTEAGMRKARRLAEARGVELSTVVGDIDHYDLGTDRWDLIVSIFAHTPPDVRRRFHQRLATALRPGGRFILEAYTPDQVGRGTGGPPVPELTMTLSQLTGELDELRITHSLETTRPVIEGAGHSGDGAVVQIVATTE